MPSSMAGDASKSPPERVKFPPQNEATPLPRTTVWPPSNKSHDRIHLGFRARGYCSVIASMVAIVPPANWKYWMGGTMPEIENFQEYVQHCFEVAKLTDFLE